MHQLVSKDELEARLAAVASLQLVDAPVGGDAEDLVVKADEEQALVEAARALGSPELDRPVKRLRVEGE